LRMSSNMAPRMRIPA
ncbi:hypothetical protein D047_0233B, partial [Vibrio parahaemolyticus VPTS-2010_2]